MSKRLTKYDDIDRNLSAIEGCLLTAEVYTEAGRITEPRSEWIKTAKDYQDRPTPEQGGTG